MSISRLENFLENDASRPEEGASEWKRSEVGERAQPQHEQPWRTHLDRVDDQSHEAGHELVRRVFALRVGFVLREIVRQRQRVRVSQGGHVGVVQRGVIQGAAALWCCRRID